MMYKKELVSKEEILFRDNFSFILKKSKQIIQSPQCYGCKPDFIGMSNPYAAPYLTLGNLCQLWEEGKFKTTCEVCSNPMYLLRGSGNLGGGICFRTSFCKYCGEYYSEEKAKIGKSLYVGEMLIVYTDFTNNGNFKRYKNTTPFNIEQVLDYLNKKSD